MMFVSGRGILTQHSLPLYEQALYEQTPALARAFLKEVLGTRNLHPTMSPFHSDKEHFDTITGGTSMEPGAVEWRSVRREHTRIYRKPPALGLIRS